MKIKQIIYFVLIVLGAVIMFISDKLQIKEYGLIIGIVLLMLGIYGSTRVYGTSEKEDETKNDHNDNVQSRG